MKTLLPPLLGCLLVVLVLFALISKDPTGSSGSGAFTVGEEISQLGDGLDASNSCSGRSISRRPDYKHGDCQSAAAFKKLWLLFSTRGRDDERAYA